MPNKECFTPKLVILILLLLSLTTGAALAQNGNLTVNVSNFKNTKGACRYWLYNTADGFPNNEKKALKIVEAPITGTTSQYVFNNLPPGTYAVAAAHDENGNHKFDTNFMGIPKERYGNTNGQRGGIGGPPKFEKCSFLHGKLNTVVSIKIE